MKRGIYFYYNKNIIRREDSSLIITVMLPADFYPDISLLKMYCRETAG